jgi:2-polyprenyl-3-methyl-5-hydroxy-6-metoxy-1,4-benzoquinol methylase
MDTPDADDTDITSGHPTTRHLQAAATPAEPTGPAVAGPYSASFPADAHLSFDVVSYGPDIADERTLRLLGPVEGKRVLELGCGGGQASIALAKQGAKVITVDPSAERLDEVRAACDREEVKVELHQGDLAELPFVRAETIDVVLSTYALATVPDLDRVFRQVHRVLRQECAVVFSIPHPAFALFDPAGADPLRIARSYFDRTPRPWSAGGVEGADHPRTISDVFTGLMRANFRVDTLLEPSVATDTVRSAYFIPTMNWVPATLVIRARKEGL